MDIVSGAEPTSDGEVPSCHWAPRRAFRTESQVFITLGDPF